MSKETAEWLNTQTLIGFTEKRGNAWHYQAALQGDEPNHYVGPVPVKDVERRLFNWEAVAIPHTYTYQGKTYTSNRIDIVRSDTPEVLLGVFTNKYALHQYREWLLKKVVSLLDDGLAVGSAGLLQSGGQAWVSVEVPENIETPEGVEFRPNLIAATSFNGSISSTYARTIMLPVCDNTLAAGLNEKGQKIKFRHSKYSNIKVQDAREALQIMFSVADDFAAEVKALCATTVPSYVWDKMLNKFVPTEGKTGRGLTMAENKREKLQNLYDHDVRVEPWAGTAFGVLQAFNTYEHHYAGTKNQSVTQRNRTAAITGSIMEKDVEVLKALDALGVPVGV